MSDPRILRPCQLCGEAQHLRIDEGEFERTAVIDGAVQEPVWVLGQLQNAEYVDGIYCQVCDTSAALDVWNGTRPASDYAVLRDFDEAPQ